MRPGRFDFSLAVNHPDRDRVIAYLDAPTQNAYKQLGFAVDEERQKIVEKSEEAYRKLSDPVKRAVGAFCKGKNFEVRFAFVESALKEVAETFAAKGDETTLEKVALAKLEECRTLQEDSEDGPPKL